MTFSATNNTVTAITSITSQGPAGYTRSGVQDLLARYAAFLESPRGRFWSAVRDLREYGFVAEADALDAIYRGSITSLNGPEVNADAVGRAIRILNGINHSTAQDGINALTELLAPINWRAA